MTCSFKVRNIMLALWTCWVGLRWCHGSLFILGFFFSFSQSCIANLLLSVACKCAFWNCNAFMQHLVFNVCSICRQGLEEQRNFFGNIRKLPVEKCRKRTSPSHLGFVSFTWWMRFNRAQRKWHDLSPWINTDCYSPIGGICDPRANVVFGQTDSFRQDVNTMRTREYWSRYHQEGFCLHAHSLQCRMASTERLYEVWMLYCNKVNGLQWMHFHRVNAFLFSCKCTLHHRSSTVLFIYFLRSACGWYTVSYTVCERLSWHLNALWRDPLTSGGCECSDRVIIDGDLINSLCDVM